MIKSKIKNDLFSDLFVLELANNHWGKVDRGIAIIQEHAAVVRQNSVKAAIKLQFRDVDSFIHPAYKGVKDNRYIAKTEATKMSEADYGVLVKAIRKVACIPMSTPFDEKSVDLCVKFEMPIIKIASSDVNDWPLIEKIASTRIPVIISSGGASEKDLDDLVIFFERRDIPLAINHCVSLYPSEPEDMELNQIHYLAERYPDHIIGLSSHEYMDWEASMHISYAKGARTWERHIDIERDGVKVSPYCSLPENIDRWFKAYNMTRRMCGGSGLSKRVNSGNEVRYLDALVRGVYARRDLPEGYEFNNESFNEDFYLAIPLLKGQLSCREILNGEKLSQSIKKDEPLTIDDVSGPYKTSDYLRQFIMDRGL